MLIQGPDVSMSKNLGTGAYNQNGNLKWHLPLGVYRSLCGRAVSPPLQKSFFSTVLEFFSFILDFEIIDHQ